MKHCLDRSVCSVLRLDVSHVRIEAPRMAEVLRIRCRAAQALRIEHFGGSLDLDRIDLLKLSEIIGFGQVTIGVPNR